MLPPLTAWFLTFLVHSTLLGVCGFALVRWLGRPATRVVALRSVLLGGFLSASLASLLPVGPTIELSPLQPTPAVTDEPEASPVIALSGSGATERLAPERSHEQAAPTPASTPLASTGWAPMRWVTGGLPLACLILGFFGVARLLFRERRSRALLADRKPLDLERLPQSVARLVTTSTRGDVRVSTTTKVSSPLALGSREIVLPERALDELTTGELAALVAHELAHLERRDPTWLGLARCAAALAWFQPLSGRALARLEDETEQAADAHAIRRTDRALDLATCLERVGTWLTDEPTPANAATMGRAGEVLVRRVERLLSVDPNARAKVKQASAGMLVAVAALACTGPSFLAGDSLDEPGIEAFSRALALDGSKELQLDLAADDPASATARLSLAGSDTSLDFASDDLESGRLREVLIPLFERAPKARLAIEAQPEMSPAVLAETLSEVVLAGCRSLDCRVEGLESWHFEAESAEEMAAKINAKAQVDTSPQSSEAEIERAVQSQLHTHYWPQGDPARSEVAVVSASAIRPISLPDGRTFGVREFERGDRASETSRFELRLLQSGQLLGAQEDRVLVDSSATHDILRPLAEVMEKDPKWGSRKDGFRVVVDPGTRLEDYLDVLGACARFDTQILKVEFQLPGHERSLETWLPAGDEVPEPVEETEEGEPFEPLPPRSTMLVERAGNHLTVRFGEVRYHFLGSVILDESKSARIQADLDDWFASVAKLDHPWFTVETSLGVRVEDVAWLLSRGLAAGVRPAFMHPYRPSRSLAPKDKSIEASTSRVIVRPGKGGIEWIVEGTPYASSLAATKAALDALETSEARHVSFERDGWGVSLDAETRKHLREAAAFYTCEPRELLEDE